MPVNSARAGQRARRGSRRSRRMWRNVIITGGHHGPAETLGRRLNLAKIAPSSAAKRVRMSSKPLSCQSRK